MQTNNEAEIQAFNSASKSKGVWALPGTYPDVEILLTKVQTGMDNIETFICEMFIHDSNVPERPAGTKMGWVFKKRFKSIFYGNIRTFIAAAVGAKFDDINYDMYNAAISDAQPLTGTRCSLTVVQKTTKTGKVYSEHNFKLNALSPGMKALLKQ